MYRHKAKPSVPRTEQHSVMADLVTSQVSLNGDDCDVPDVTDWLAHHPEFVEKRLAAIKLGNNRGSILDQLRTPGKRVTQAEAATQLLDDLAEGVRESSTQALLIWQYVKFNRLWDTHSDEALRSETAFIAGLADRVGVKALFVVGATTTRECRGYIKHIDRHWGPNWIDVLKEYNVLPLDVVKDGLRKNLLIEIARNAK